MAKSMLVGAQVRWTSVEIFEIGEDRVGLSQGRPTERPTAIEVGTTGTVVQASAESVRVVLDEIYRATGEVDEVEWDWQKPYGARSIASRAVEVVEEAECPACGNADGRLFDADCKRLVWTVFCVGEVEGEADVCGMTVLEEDLSEAARLEAAADIERDGPFLAQIRAILGDGAGEWCGCHEGDFGDFFDGKASAAALALLALFNERRSMETV